MEYFGWSEADPHSLHGAHKRLYDVRRRLKDVGPDVIEKVNQGILTAEPVHAQGDVLYGRHGRLPMYKVSTNTKQNNQISG